jgi:hypothetical protein
MTTGLDEEDDEGDEGDLIQRSKVKNQRPNRKSKIENYVRATCK